MAGLLNIVTGSNSPFIPIFSGFGRATLVNGITTVYTSLASINMKILLTPQDVNTLGNVRVDNIQPGVSFDINSTGSVDSGVIFWAIVLQSSQITPLIATIVNGAATFSYPLSAVGMTVFSTAQDINTNGTLQLNAIVPGVSFDLVSTAPADNGGVVLAAVVQSGLNPLASEIIQIGKTVLVNGEATVLTSLPTLGLNLLVSAQDINTLGSVRIDNVVPGTIGASFDLNSTGNNDSGVIAWLCVN